MFKGKKEIIPLAALLFIVRFGILKNKKIVAGDTGLVTEKQTISYDSIEKIDKTHFDSKGYFIITYKNADDGESQLKISDKNYDNLGAVLDELITKIS